MFGDLDTRKFALKELNNAPCFFPNYSRFLSLSYDWLINYNSNLIRKTLGGLKDKVINKNIKWSN